MCLTSLHLFYNGLYDLYFKKHHAFFCFQEIADTLKS